MAAHLVINIFLRNLKSKPRETLIFVSSLFLTQTFIIENFKHMENKQNSIMNAIYITQLHQLLTFCHSLII